MKTIALIAAAMIGTAGLGTSAIAQTTEAAQQKVLRYQQDQREKVWHEQRLDPGRVIGGGTYGAPARQSFGQDDAAASEEVQVPSNMSIPGSGAAFYSYDKDNKGWAYGY